MSCNIFFILTDWLKPLPVHVHGGDQGESKIHQAWQTFSANGSQLAYKFLVLLFILLFNSPLSPKVLWHYYYCTFLPPLSVHGLGLGKATVKR